MLSKEGKVDFVNFKYKCTSALIESAYSLLLMVLCELGQFEHLSFEEALLHVVKFISTDGIKVTSRELLLEELGRLILLQVGCDASGVLLDLLDVARVL